MTDKDAAAAERLLQSFSQVLATWLPGDDLAPLCNDYKVFLRLQGARAVRRELGRAHLTASAFVFTPDLAFVLLCFHKKGNFWVQLGGHIEGGDNSVQAAALREAREEGGINDLQLISPDPLDLDRHDLAAGFVDCATHWDVGYGFVASADALPSTSDESTAVRWWAIDALPTETPPGFSLRIALATNVARARLTSQPWSAPAMGRTTGGLKTRSMSPAPGPGSAPAGQHPTSDET